ncbi:MAG TPA: hypothetical protein DIW47_12260 [Bacteroidetes bacterium]|nr:hypothetical protein [Bacteroidota bacterium]
MFAQWSGTNPVTTNSDVGISTSSPAGYLHISPTYTGGVYPLALPLILADYNLFGSHITTFTATNYGRVGIGTASPSETCHVLGSTLLQGNTVIQGNLTVNNGTNNQFQVTSNGLLIARQVDVHLDPIPDYVFHAAFNKDSAALYSKAGNYKMLSLYEIDDFVKKHHHLPGIKSASQYESIGTVNLGELNAKLLEKIEELTLHTISQQREIDNLKDRLEKLETTSVAHNIQPYKSQSMTGVVLAAVAIFAIVIGSGRFSKLSKK